MLFNKKSKIATSTLIATALIGAAGTAEGKMRVESSQNKWIFERSQNASTITKMDELVHLLSVVVPKKEPLLLPRKYLYIGTKDNEKIRKWLVSNLRDVVAQRTERPDFLPNTPLNVQLIRPESKIPCYNDATIQEYLLHEVVGACKERMPWDSDKKKMLASCVQRKIMDDVELRKWVLLKFEETFWEKHIRTLPLRQAKNGYEAEVSDEGWASHNAWVLAKRAGYWYSTESHKLECAILDPRNE